MKSIWKGTISFGLVSIPVRLYSAVQEHVLGFKMLHDKCHMPVSYQRWCQHCKKEVSWENIVKGLKLEDGSYAVLTQEKIKELKPTKSDSIAIVEFVSAAEIDPIYLEHHYYLGPEKAGESSFYLFKKALEKSGKVAIGTLVMRDKQYACVINPHDKTMLLSTLNYAYEIRDINEVPNLDKQPKQISATELKLAEQLINQITSKKFDLTKFKDTFAEQLKIAIKKSKKEKISSKKKKKTDKADLAGKKEKAGSLATALRASLIAPGKSSEIARAKKRS